MTEGLEVGGGGRAGISGSSLGAEGCLCPEQLAGDAVPRPGPV